MNYSVLMSLYRKENPIWFKDALDSMIKQTIPPYEIVIVEAGPLTKELYQVIEEYKKIYGCLIVVVKSKENIGLGSALNIGLDKCSNEIVFRMDTDDISLPNRCEIQLAYLDKHPEIALLGTWVDEFSNDPAIIKSTRKVPIGQKMILQFAKRRNPFNHPTVVYKKSVIQKIGGYSNLRYGQDYELFGRLIMDGYLVDNIPRSLLLFRSDENTIKRRKNKESITCYFDTIYKFYKLGFSSFTDVLWVYITQMLIRILPDFIVDLIYKFVRK